MMMMMMMMMIFQSERYLSLFKQFQELGFSDHRIKEELVKSDLDSDKTLDSLTAWALYENYETEKICGCLEVL